MCYNYSLDTASKLRTFTRNLAQLFVQHVAVVNLCVKNLGKVALQGKKLVSRTCPLYLRHWVL
jgi:hypothetical protein